VGKEKKDKFNTNWLLNNGYNGLYTWTNRNIKLEELVALSGDEELKKAYEKRPSAKGVIAGELIDLAVFKPRDLEARIKMKGIGLGVGHLPDLSNYKDEPSELQKLRFEIGQALKTGKWSDELIDKYIEFHSYLPDFVFHHLSVNDIIKRAKTAEIKLPHTVLSIAGGAYGEAIAWQRSGISNPPTVITLDSSHRMLGLAKKKIAEKYQINEKYLDSVWGQMRNIKEVIKENFKIGDFELVECSSVDNLNTQELPDFIENISSIIKVGQCVQLLSRIPYPEELIKIFQDNNFILHTPFNSVLNGRLDKKTTLSEDVARRLKDKIRPGRYYILAEKVNPEDLSKKKERVLEDILNQAIALPKEEQPTQADILSLIEKFGSMKNLPNDLLAKLGWKLEIIPGKGLSGMIVHVSKIK
jgi:hypothetical protein